MQMIRWAMDEVDPKIILYGEGWDMGTGLAPYDKSKRTCLSVAKYWIFQ